MEHQYSTITKCNQAANTLCVCETLHQALTEKTAHNCDKLTYLIVLPSLAMACGNW